MVEANEDPLVGCWFHIFENDRAGGRQVVRYQGIVKSKVNNNAYLVQIHPFTYGKPKTLHIVPLIDMCGSWVFYENHRHMVDASERSEYPLLDYDATASRRITVEQTGGDQTDPKIAYRYT